MNVLLVEDGRTRVLIDTGAGDKLDEKRQRIYGIAPKSAADVLAPAGLAPGEIDLVVSTHLHFDHAGGHTTRNERGEVVAAFPNATYAVQEGEIEVARWDNEKTRASYLAEDFEPLVRDGRVRGLRGDTALGPHLSVRVAPGHTPFHQVALIATKEGTVAFLADLVPTASHVRPLYIMAYDLEPLTTLATKKRLLPEAARERWRVVFEHDADVPVGSIEEHAGAFRARRDPGEA
jgi:glyoxylase-like metal-dependent hydrolase (beta-lactamase superfamily II)